jgi:hypothetical protein
MNTTDYPRSNLSKILRISLLRSLAGGALLTGGFSLLGAGNARAGWDLTPPNGYLCAFGGMRAQCEKSVPTPTPVARPGSGLSPEDKLLTLLNWSPSLAANTDSDIAFTLQPDGWHVDLDFETNLIGGDSGWLEYTIAITDPHYHFATATLKTFTTSAGDYSVSKEFFTDATFSTEITSWQLDNPPSPDGVRIGGKTIYVRDTWSLVSGSEASIDAIQNVYTQTVPGPLPVLGAGVAFGFSRKLRNRIQAVRRVKA